ncbi:unnamed protein product, partial [Leptidea sinapis]
MTVTVTPDRRDGTAQRWGPPRRVTLKRSPGQPLGVSIVGGKVDIISGREDANGNDKGIFGIFIKNVVADSPAGRCGDLHTGDRILEVDGSCVRTAQHERAVQLIKASGNTVTLTVQSLVTWSWRFVTSLRDSSDASPPAATPRPSIKKRPAPSAPSLGGATQKHDIKITVTSDIDAKESESKVEKDTEEKEVEDKPKTIDRASAGAIKRSREEKEADPEQEDDFGYTARKAYVKEVSNKNEKCRVSPNRLNQR